MVRFQPIIMATDLNSLSIEHALKKFCRSPFHKPHRVGFVDNHIGLEYTWFIKRGSKKSLLSEKSQSKRGTGDY